MEEDHGVREEREEDITAPVALHIEEDQEAVAKEEDRTEDAEVTEEDMAVTENGDSKEPPSFLVQPKSSPSSQANPSRQPSRSKTIPRNL